MENEVKKRRKNVENTYQDEITKPKRRTTQKKVEYQTIRKEKAINYKKNFKVFLTFVILSVLLFIYILYLVVMAFISI